MKSSVQSLTLHKRKPSNKTRTLFVLRHAQLAHCRMLTPDRKDPLLLCSIFSASLRGLQTPSSGSIWSSDHGEVSQVTGLCIAINQSSRSIFHEEDSYQLCEGGSRVPQITLFKSLQHIKDFIMCVYATCEQVPTETWREYWIPRSWS